MQPESLTCGTILLTGATGVLGANLLKELLATTDADIFCLVDVCLASEFYSIHFGADSPCATVKTRPEPQ